VKRRRPREPPKTVTRLLTRSSDVDLVDEVNPSRVQEIRRSYAWRQLLEGADLNQWRESPASRPISGLKFAFAARACCHRSVISPPFPSRCLATDRLDRVVEVQRPLLRGRAHRRLGVTCQKEEDRIKLFGSLVRNGQDNESRTKMSRDNSALSSPMSLISFSLC
jgi:hypothetical protein